jgi:hypothetical protein
VNNGTKAATVIVAEKNTARSTCSTLWIGRIAAIAALGQVFEQLAPVVRFQLEVAEDVFDHDHGRVDDDAEIDGTDRQQIRILPLQHQQDNREKQRKWNVYADDDRAAQITQEYPLDEEHQQAAEDQILQHGVGGYIHEAGAIVVRHNFDARRQRTVVVHIVDHRTDARHHIVSVIGAAHDDDR